MPPFFKTDLYLIQREFWYWLKEHLFAYFHFSSGILLGKERTYHATHIRSNARIIVINIFCNEYWIIKIAKNCNITIKILAFFGTTLCDSQFFNMGPNFLWFNNQAWNFFELWAKAHSATSKKGVVGMPGTNIPKKAKPTHIQPNDNKKILFTIIK